MGIDVDNDFELKYITIRGKGELLTKLRKAAKKADKIYLATDWPGRGGDFLASDQVLEGGGWEDAEDNFQWDHKDGGKDSLIKQARKLNMNLVEAQQAEFWTAGGI